MTMVGTGRRSPAVGYHQLLLLLVGVVLLRGYGWGGPDLVSGLPWSKTPSWRGRGGGDVPSCGEGFQFFRDFMKCDASLHYCFAYKNDSCVGPPNWVCVHNLNRKADIEGSETDVDIKNQGFGNTRCCGGKYQSPINIPADDAKCRSGMPTPFYYQPAKTLHGIYENTGYYPKFFVESEKYVDPLVLTNVPFTCAISRSPDYVFANIHIHNGVKSEHGSAHFVSGKAYDAEFHIVHKHINFWSPGKMDTRCASQTPLGLAVIGVFLSLTEGERNAEVDRLLKREYLEKIKDSNVICPYDKICNPESSSSASEEDDDYCEEIDFDFDNKHASWNDRTDLWHRLNRRFRRDSEERNDGTSRKVVCFCRKRKFEELLFPYAGRGEERMCREQYFGHHNPSMLRAQTATAMDTEQQACNQHGNGNSCGSSMIKDFPLRPGLLLPRRREYWQYFGSLTTPPCSEVVNWIVMKQPIRITEQQLDNLRLLESRREDHLISEYGNVRPVQPINGRTVLSSNC